MPVIKSLSVRKGDLFYIKHGSDNFTIIDCNLVEGREEELLDEIKSASQDKGVIRFISTHPDEDHFHGIEHLDDAGLCRNFYCVQNNVTKDKETPSFKRYKALRNDPKKAYHIYKDCSRQWMNRTNEDRGSAGINILWPDVNSEVFAAFLEEAESHNRPNSISPIIKYRLEDGVTAVWMGDLEADCMEQILDLVNLPKVDILFAPHHGRKSGHVPAQWLERMEPKIIVVGEAPSEDLEYYSGYNMITQNSSGDIEFDCGEGIVHVRVSSPTYTTSYLEDAGENHHKLENGNYLWYIGSFDTHCQPN